jgi:prepilin-type N-terminal cleavage/methylation domain-containing protein
MRIRRKQPFTLIELMLVLALVATLAGLIGINVGKAMREQRFRSEVDLVMDKLRLAQDLMVLYYANADVVIAMLDNDQGYSLEVTTEVPIPSAMLREIHKQEKLNNIHHISFTGLDRETDKLSLPFRSGGSNMAKGLLRLSNAEIDGPGVWTRYIDLSGYPAPIVASSTKPQPKKGEEFFLRDLTQRTIEAVRAKQNS